MGFDGGVFAWEKGGFIKVIFRLNWKIFGGVFKWNRFLWTAEVGRVFMKIFDKTFPDDGRMMEGGQEFWTKYLLKRNRKGFLQDLTHNWPLKNP